MRATAFACALGVSASCGTESAASLDPFAPSADPITNGTLDVGDPAVVALVTADRDPQHGLCTGTLVSTRVVVSAGHCARTPTGALDLAVAFVGNALDQGGELIDVSHRRAHPDFTRGPPLSNDIGVFVLAAEAAVEPLPMIAAGGLDASLVNEEVRLVGFGRTASTDTSSPAKREGRTVVAQLDETTFTFAPSPSSTCLGDSGGPVLAIASDGSERLIGVASQGDPQCSAYATATRVDAFAETFVLPMLAATANGSAELGAPCYHADNCAAGLVCSSATDDPRIHYCTAGCDSDTDCIPGMVCRQEHAADPALCHYLGPTPGAFGAPCDAAFDCIDNLCLQAAVGGEQICSRWCVPAAERPCPVGYVCQPAAGTRSACFARRAERGCRAAGSLAGGIVSLLLGAVALRRRRRSRARDNARAPVQPRRPVGHSNRQVVVSMLHVGEQ